MWDWWRVVVVAGLRHSGRDALRTVVPSPQIRSAVIAAPGPRIHASAASLAGDTRTSLNPSKNS